VLFDDRLRVEVFVGDNLGWPAADAYGCSYVTCV